METDRKQHEVCSDRITAFSTHLLSSNGKLVLVDGTIYLSVPRPLRVVRGAKQPGGLTKSLEYAEEWCGHVHQESSQLTWTYPVPHLQPSWNTWCRHMSP